MNREQRQSQRRRQREEQERIESEIALLERRLTSLRIQLQVNQRQQEVQVRRDRDRRQNRPANRPGDGEVRFTVGDRVQVTNRRDDLFGEEGTVTQVSRGNHFIYFRLENGTIRYRRPQNLLRIPEQQNE